jgi:hypothetical protein
MIKSRYLTGTILGQPHWDSDRRACADRRSGR